MYFQVPFTLSFLCEKERDSDQNVNKVKIGAQVGREERAESLEIPQCSFRGLAFKMCRNDSEQRTLGAHKSVKVLKYKTLSCLLTLI